MGAGPSGGGWPQRPVVWYYVRGLVRQGGFNQLPAGAAVWTRAQLACGDLASPGWTGGAPPAWESQIAALGKPHRRLG